MVLSGEAIKRGIREGIIGVSPFSEEQVEAAHVNLHLSEHEAMDGGFLRIAPKGFIIAHTREKITLPSGICGLIEGRAKLAIQGISVEQSSTLIEPESNNTITLEIFNASDHEVTLSEGQKIAKMILLKIADEI